MEIVSVMEILKPGSYVMQKFIQEFGMSMMLICVCYGNSKAWNFGHGKGQSMFGMSKMMIVSINSNSKA